MRKHGTSVLRKTYFSGLIWGYLLGLNWLGVRTNIFFRVIVVNHLYVVSILVAQTKFRKRFFNFINEFSKLQIYIFSRA